MYNEEKETSLASKICKHKEFELECALELYPVLYASCSSAKCKGKDWPTWADSKLLLGW